MKKIYLLTLLLCVNSLWGFGQEPPGLHNPDWIIDNPIETKAAPPAKELTAPTPTTIDFEGIGNNVPINDFYNSAYGITFIEAHGLIGHDHGGTGNFVNEPSPITVMFWTGGTYPTMNVATGFQGTVSFYYTARHSGSLLVYQTLPSNITGVEFNVFTLVSIAFSGTAYSIVFEGTSNQIGFDNITLTVNADSEPPQVTCQDIEIDLSGSGEGYITVTDVEASSSDNIEIVEKWLDKYYFTCEDVGENTVTLTVTDAAGNTATCYSTVTVTCCEGAKIFDCSIPDTGIKVVESNGFF